MNTEEQSETDLTDQLLWVEMFGRWKQILKAVAAKRVVPDRAFEIFRETFQDRMYSAQKFVGCDAIDSRVSMLWGLVQEDRGSFVESYFQWIQEKVLKELFDDIAHAQRQITETEQQLQTLQGTLSTLSWWDSLWKTTELESQIEDTSNQIKSWKDTLIELAPKMRSEVGQDGLAEERSNCPKKIWTIECVDEMVYIPAGQFYDGSTRR